MSKRTIKAGETIHAVADGLTIRTGMGMLGAAYVTRRGQNIVVSSALIEASRNRLGEVGWPSIVHDPEAQIRKWGRVYLAPGEAPADLLPFEPGSPEWAEERERRRKLAHIETDPVERTRLLAEVNRVFGPAPTSKTIWTERGPGAQPNSITPRDRTREAERALAEQQLASREVGA